MPTDFLRLTLTDDEAESLPAEDQEEIEHFARLAREEGFFFTVSPVLHDDHFHGMAQVEAVTNPGEKDVDALFDHIEAGATHLLEYVRAIRRIYHDRIESGIARLEAEQEVEETIQPQFVPPPRGGFQA